MSKWLQSTTGLSYTVKGKVVGKEPVQLADAEVDAVIKTPVIASLIKNGAIKVLDKYDAPSDAGADTVKLRALTEENAKLADEIRALKAASNDDDDELEAANAKIADLEKQLSEAKEAEASANAKFDELKTEAEAKIAELQEQLEQATTKTTKSSKKKEDA